MEQWEAALSDYKAGMKYREIAEKYGVSESAVKSWAARKWKLPKQKKSQKKVATPKKEKLQPFTEKLHPKGGAPFGNQNAVGNSGGAPKGNTNNLRHGFYWDTLTEEEQELLAARGEVSEETRLLHELDLWEIRERRLLREINKQRAIASGLAVQKLEKTGSKTKTTAISTLENITRLENLLTAAQRAHIRCIEALHQIHREDGGEGDNSMDALMSILNAARSKEGND